MVSRLIKFCTNYYCVWRSANHAHYNMYTIIHLHIVQLLLCGVSHVHTITITMIHLHTYAVIQLNLSFYSCASQHEELVKNIKHRCK